MRLIDITGQRFGVLTVIQKHVAPAKTGGSLWLCHCDCGNQKVANASNLRSGGISSCGCKSKEWAKKMGSNPIFIEKRAAAAVRHGANRRGKRTPEYATWLRIKSRCYRETDKDYPNWGGRGIRVSDEWLSSFETFLSDMGERPGPGYSIDRIDPNGDYRPGNCRWVTPTEQGAENKRSNAVVTVGDQTFASMSAACRAFGLKHTTVRNRIMTGMSVDVAFGAAAGTLVSRRDRKSYIRKS